MKFHKKQTKHYKTKSTEKSVLFFIEPRLLCASHIPPDEVGLHREATSSTESGLHPPTADFIAKRFQTPMVDFITRARRGERGTVPLPRSNSR